jgi:hypothetical protein
MSQMNNPKQNSKPTTELKEFCLTRTRTTYEYCYVMATDWEDAEDQGHQQQDWEQSDDRTEIDVEECK